MSLFDFGKPEEFQIPVGYGYLTAKAWGPKNGQPLLGLHGLRDNIGTFESLLRYLPSTYRFVALDFSFHGKSSPLPKGLHPSKLMFIVEICRLVKYLGWQSFSILGHSKGAAVGLIFASAYPEKIKHIICFDFLYPGSLIMEPLPCQMAIDTFLSQENRAETVNEFVNNERALEHILQSRPGLPKKTGMAILERCMEFDDYGSCVVRLESRLRNFNFVEFVEEDVFKELENITAHCLIITGDISPAVKTMPKQQAMTKEILMKNCSSFKEVELLAMHFVHAEQVVKCCKLIKSFLLR